ncbi:UNVERIFIED_CONTAM: hypothetical protein PYX00_009416 [Menopon gallinae]|uniref:Galectin n=1 Tax=Menopon gallinae TaxID=328185 RepID=A0AAW2HBA3_9NEOP
MRKISSCFRGNDVTKGSVYSPRGSCLRGDSDTKFYCCGSPTRSGTFSKRHGMYKSESDNKSDVVETGVEADESYYVDDVTITDPTVPYLDEFPVDLFLGRVIEVSGKTSRNCNRFSINFCIGNEPNSDISLHLNPRLDRRIVVRNHRICNRWGVEEIVSAQPFPFKTDKNFSVLIFISDDQFLIAINKIHFCAFTFRIPIKNITHLLITGDISLELLNFTTKTFYPPRIFHKRPYIIVPRTVDRSELKCDIRRKVQYLGPGTKVEIWGRLKLMPRGFYVNLQEGIDLWPHPIVPFHMNLRINPPGTSKREYEIIFNSWYRGGWEKETPISFCPFLPGTDFILTIDCNPTCFLVQVNDKFLFKYNRPDDAYMDCVFIFGDVVVQKVILKRISIIESAVNKMRWKPTER